MLGWLVKKLRGTEPQSPWSVEVDDQVIRTSDGQGTSRELPVTGLRSVVVATDDSGPWGDDVVFLLYSDAPDPVGLFPLEARGCQDFVAWMSGQPGYRDRELANAMGSTNVARFLVFERQN